MSDFHGNKFSKIEKLACKKGYKIDKGGTVINKKQKIMKLKIINGYKMLRFRDHNNKMLYIKASRLQAYMKFGDKIYESNICVRHLNGNSLDDRWDNITIGTHSDNIQDIPKDIRIKSASIASNKRKAAYSKEMIIAIKEAHKEGLSYKNIMDKFGISSKSTISYIVNNRYVFYGID